MESVDALVAAIRASGARVHFVGRRALAHRISVVREDIEKLNAALAALGYVSDRTPEEARAQGRYTLSNAEYFEVSVDDPGITGRASRPPIAPRLAALAEQPLAPEEFERRVAQAVAELDGEEGENLASLIQWFQRRYPTPAARLAYARRRANQGR